MLETDNSTYEKPEDVKSEAELVARWKKEISLASEEEKPWREKAEQAIKAYQCDKSEKTPFPILFANTEILRPSLYNSTPRPDVRRRFRDPDPVGREACEIMQRALSYCIDDYDFDGFMAQIVLDYCLTGRAVGRVKFEPIIASIPNPMTGVPEEALVDARTIAEKIHWDRFRHGPGRVWEEVTWVAYEHQLTYAEMQQKFPGFEDRVNYDVSALEKSDEAQNSLTMAGAFKRTCVWEIMDREKRQTYFLSTSYADSFLKVEQKLDLDGYFDCPRPIYSVDNPDTLIPVPEYDIYRSLADELNGITRRIKSLIAQCRVRGIYDATITEIRRLLTEGLEGDLIPIENAAAAMQNGGIERAIWLMPVDKIAQVIAQLTVQREQTKQIIYEITGLSDILRGSSDPNETLGAQELKAQNSSLRLQRRQREVQRFVRDILRIKAEIIAENYTPEMLSMMTGKQVTPEIMTLMRQDKMRRYKIDIETDSTIAGDQRRDRQDVVELIEGIGGYVQQMAPAVQSGAVSMEAAKAILISSIRKFRLGPEVEDAIEQSDIEQRQNPQQPQPDPEADARREEMQLKRDELQMKHQVALAELALKERQVSQQPTENQAQPQQPVPASPPQIHLNAQDLFAPANEALNGAAQNMSAIVAAQTEQSAQNIQILGALMQTISQQTAVMTELVATLNAPKRLVRDKQGRPAGVETIKSSSIN